LELLCVRLVALEGVEANRCEILVLGPRSEAVLSRPRFNTVARPDEFELDGFSAPGSRDFVAEL
jgi:hypothetical protein